MAEYAQEFTSRDLALQEFSNSLARLIEKETAVIVHTLCVGCIVGAELSWMHVEPCDKPCCTHPASAVFTVTQHDD